MNSKARPHVDVRVVDRGYPDNHMEYLSHNLCDLTRRNYDPSFEQSWSRGFLDAILGLFGRGHFKEWRSKRQTHEMMYKGCDPLCHDMIMVSRDLHVAIEIVRSTLTDEQREKVNKAITRQETLEDLGISLQPAFSCSEP